MYSVGILATGSEWSDVLTGMTEASGSRVTGWLNPAEVSADDTCRLIDHSDLVWIPEMINGGMDEAITVIRRSRHLSLGFPVSDFMDQAENLLKLSQEARVQVQVGHAERHRPVFRSSLSRIRHPQHIGVRHYLTDSPSDDNKRLIFNEILADLDLVLGLAGSQARKVRTHVSFLGPGQLFQIDTRTEFHNGSMISLVIRQGMPEPVREIEIIQESGVLTIDLVGGTSDINGFSGGTWNRERIWPLSGETAGMHPEQIGKSEECARQCINFIHALGKGQQPLSGLEEGFSALEITRQIAAAAGRI